MTKTKKDEHWKKAEGMYESIYKAIWYIHREFTRMFQSAYIRSMAGKHVKKTIEEQLMRKYGVSKYRDIYLQDEVALDPMTGNRISIGPDEKTCDFVKTITIDGEVDKTQREYFLMKYSAKFRQAANLSNQGKKTGESDGGVRPKSGKRADSGGAGVNSGGNSKPGPENSSGGTGRNAKGTGKGKSLPARTKTRKSRQADNKDPGKGN